MHSIGTYELYKEAMNLRDKPSISGGILLEIPLGACIEVLEVRDGWGKTNYDEKTGWCSLSEVFTRRIGGVTTPPYCDFQELYENEKKRADQLQSILERIEKVLYERT